MTSMLKMNDDILFQFANEVKKSGYRFITITPASHQRVNSRSENRWAKSLIDVIGWSRPFQLENLPLDKQFFDLMSQGKFLVENGNEGGASYQCLIRMSTLDEELFVHSSYPTSSADAVFFGPDTYRFARSIKSMLSQRKRDALPVHRAVDIGCGAGPGAILLAKSYPDAQIYGVDINESALRLTNVNARLANVNVICYESNLLNDIQGQFDLIISNPPYLVDPLKRRYRHGGGDLGSQLSIDIVQLASQRLNRNGTLLLYTGSPIINGQDLFYQQAKDILEQTSLNWTYEEIDPDVFGEELSTESYSHADRIAAVLLIVTKNNLS